MHCKFRSFRLTSLTQAGTGSRQQSAVDYVCDDFAVTSHSRFKSLVIVTALSFGALALKGTIFGLRTFGESRVWGPPDPSSLTTMRLLWL